jgi:hypothetical protein
MPKGSKKRKAEKKKKENEAYNNISTNNPQGKGFSLPLSFFEYSPTRLI